MPKKENSRSERGIFSVLFAGFGLCGCAIQLTPPTPQQTVDVVVVINTLKCELAQYLTNPSLTKNDKLRLKGGTIAATLSLNVVDTQSAGISVEAAKLLVFGTGTSGPTLGGGYKVKRTVNTNFTINMKAEAANQNACLDKKRMGNGVGLYTWLETISGQLRGAPAYEPKATMGAFNYELVFGVTRKTNAKLKADFLLARVAATPEIAWERDDVQGVKLAFVPAPITGNPEFFTLKSRIDPKILLPTE